MMTGHYPHQTQVQSNRQKRADLTGFPFLGKIFQDAGYETAYFGKWHVAAPTSNKEQNGFEHFGDKSCQFDPKPCAEYVRQKRDRPFLAVASFLSPHEICQWARKQEVPHAPLPDVPPFEDRPPLRVNSDPPCNETDIMAHMRRSYQATGTFPVGDYTENDWRRHIWGYYRLIERADDFVGEVTDALHHSGQRENTIVVFLSDHGDCHGAHKWNQKTVFYDESSRVPFIISWPAAIQGGAVSDQLVNVGADLIPTLCDLAGVTPPDDMPGASLKPVVLADKRELDRDYVVSQNRMAQGAPVDGKDLTPEGRMIRSRRYKYCLYSEGQQRESLVDMQSDPGEMVNQAENPEFADILQRHRSYLKEFAKSNNDAVALEMLEFIE
jgi:arylsulfatase A-like enzyme